MMRIIGGILIFISSSFIGIYFARLSSYRIGELESIKKALLVFKTEMTYFDEPLLGICKSIAEKCGYPSDVIFEQFGKRLEEKNGKSADEIWKETIEGFKEGFLESEDRKRLISFGKIIGYGDGQTQLGNIDILNDYIVSTIKKLEEVSDKNRKLYTSIGILSGLMLVVAMI